MAEFSVDLQGPQGAGARVVEPVQTGSALAGVDSLFNTIAKGYESFKKKEASDLQNQVLKEYSQKMGAISEAISSGEFNSQRGGSEVRKLTNQFAAQYPQYVEELKKLHTFFVNGTEAGTALQDEAEEKKRENDMLLAAEKAGFPTFKGMSDEGKRAIINAYEAQERAKQIFEEQRKMREDFRAESKFQQGIQQDASRQSSIQLLNEIGKNNLIAFQTFGQELANKVRSGAMSADEASMQIDRQYSQLRVGVDTVAREFPDLAASTRTLMDNMRSSFRDLMDPNKPAQEAENRLKEFTAKAKMNALLADPQIKNLYVATSLFGQNIALSLDNVEVVKKVMKMTDPSTEGSIGIIGSAEEKAVIGHLREGLKNLQKGNVSDKAKAEQEAVTSVDALLREVGNTMKTGEYNPQALTQISSFIASPEYLSLSKTGKISKQGSEAAAAVMQKGLFEPAAQAAQAKLTEALSGGIFSRPNPTGGRSNSFKVTKFEPWRVGEMVDIGFDGYSVTFQPGKGVAALDEKDRQSLSVRLRELNSVATTMTQMVKVAAHLEQSSDYKDTFERYKHVLFPYVYSQYEELKIGDIKKGPDGALYRYIGGVASDGNNWKRTEK